MTTQMLLHCGAQQVDLPAIRTVDVPPATATYQPIHHSFFVDLVRHTLEGAGNAIVAEGHALARDGRNYFGTFELDGPANGHSTIVGLRNSHAKEFPAGIACGSRVFVCDNLSFSGEIVIKRRHTRWIERDLPLLVDSAIGRLGSLRTDMDARIKAYQRAELQPDYADHLIIEMLRARVITTQKVAHVLREWDKPSHEEFADSPTAWRLFNATTEALKGKVPDPRQTQALHGIMDAAVGGITLEGDYRAIH